MGKLIVFVGPSGAGKTTLASLLSEPHFRHLVSSTTRKPRQGEVDGTHYHFLDKAKWDEMFEAGLFPENDEYAGNHYGLSLKELDLVVEPKEGDDLVAHCVVLTRKGLDFVRSYLGTYNVFAVYVHAPRTTIESRLAKTRSPKEVADRLTQADATFEFDLPEDSLTCPAASCDYVVMNGDDRDLNRVIEDVLDAFATTMIPTKQRKITIDAALQSVIQQRTRLDE